MLRLARRPLLLGLYWMAFGLATACGASTASSRPTAQSSLLGKPLKHFRRPTLEGQMLNTAAYGGRVLVIEFFAKYCEPCKRTLPEAQSLSQELPDVVFVGVSEDERASEAELVARTYGLSFPVVHDSGNVLAGRFRVSELPATFVVDRRGVVQWVGSAEHDAADLRAAIEAAAR